MNELTVQELKVNYELPIVTYDLTPLSEEVTELAAKYQGIIIKESNIPTMKQDIAVLNKISKAIDDKRKAIAKEVKKPITQFESDIKGLVSLLKDTYRNMKDQIDEYEAMAKEERRKEIMQFDEWLDYMIFDEKWLNKSMTDKKVRFEMDIQKNAYESGKYAVLSLCKSKGLHEDKYISMLNPVNLPETLQLIENDSEIKAEYTPETDNTIIEVSCSESELSLIKSYMRELGIKFKVRS